MRVCLQCRPLSAPWLGGTNLRRPVPCLAGTIHTSQCTFPEAPPAPSMMSAPIVKAPVIAVVSGNQGGHESGEGERAASAELRYWVGMALAILGEAGSLTTAGDPVGLLHHVCRHFHLTRQWPALVLRDVKRENTHTLDSTASLVYIRVRL